jgi:hypothetical protein
MVECNALVREEGVWMAETRASGAAGSFFERLGAIVAGVASTQGEAIDAAAHRCADAIAGDGFVHLFGAGHSHMPCIDVYPRIGDRRVQPGGRLTISRFSNVVGADGIPRVPPRKVRYAEWC